MTDDEKEREATRERLLRDAREQRLSPEVKAEILREMPGSEEMERLVRELMAGGGYTFEEMVASFPEKLQRGFRTPSE